MLPILGLGTSLRTRPVTHAMQGQALQQAAPSELLHTGPARIPNGWTGVHGAIDVFLNPFKKKIPLKAS